MEKLYFNKDNLTPDITCAMQAPVVLHGADTKTRHYNADFRGWQSAPCIVITPKGRLYCTFSGDNSEKPDESPNNYNIITVSDDGGKTWRDGEWIIDHPCSVRMHEPVLWISPDGDLWHFWSQSYNWWDGKSGVWSMKCTNPDDDEPVWTKPRRLCDGVMATKPTVSRSGEWFFPVSIWSHYPSEYNSLPELMYSNVYISRDKGATLEYVGHADEPETVFDENCLEERPDGSFLMIMRTVDSISFSESFDRCKTWSKPEHRMASPSARSFLCRFPTGNLLLVAHNDFVEKIDGKDVPQRKNLTAFLSEDGGMSWKYSLLLDERINISYPCGMITRDGVAYVAYDRERFTQREVYFAAFTEQDIREGRLCTGTSRLKQLIQKSGALRTDN